MGKGPVEAKHQPPPHSPPQQSTPTTSNTWHLGLGRARVGGYGGGLHGMVADGHSLGLHMVVADGHKHGLHICTATGTSAGVVWDPMSCRTG